jgi:hypothetical protein
VIWKSITNPSPYVGYVGYAHPPCHERLQSVWHSRRGRLHSLPAQYNNQRFQFLPQNPPTFLPRCVTESWLLSCLQLASSFPFLSTFNLIPIRSLPRLPRRRRFWWKNGAARGRETSMIPKWGLWANARAFHGCKYMYLYYSKECSTSLSNGRCIKTKLRASKRG